MSKTVTFKQPAGKVAEEWVQSASMPPAAELVVKGPMKRLTVPISKELHTRLKVACVQDGRDIKDVVRDILEKAYPAT